jgi:hypothetical protein
MESNFNAIPLGRLAPVSHFTPVKQRNKTGLTHPGIGA